jgi:excisionase family DNA binding protein
MREQKDGSTGLIPDESKVMTLAEAADYLHCHYSTIYRLVRYGDLPAFRLGGNWRFLRSELEKWIAAQTSSASEEKNRKSDRTTGMWQDRVRSRKRKSKVSR